MISTLTDWLSSSTVQWALAGFSLVAVAASVVLVPRFLARLPRDYLRRPERDHSHVLRRVLKNVLGVVLVLLGVAMLLLPGQGLLTLAVGLILVDFPGKHRLVVKLLARPKVLAIVNKLRARHQAGPLEA